MWRVTTPQGLLLPQYEGVRPSFCCGHCHCCSGAFAFIFLSFSFPLMGWVFLHPSLSSLLSRPFSASTTTYNANASD